MVRSAQENDDNDVQSDTEKWDDETVVIAEPKIKSIKEAILSLEEVQYFLSYHSYANQRLFPKLRLEPTDVQLWTYTAESVSVLGSLPVVVKYQEQQHKLSVLVVKGGGSSLIGRDWLADLKLNWSAIKHLHAEEELQKFISKYPSVFSDELGSMKGIAAELKLKSGARPKFCRPRPVLYALREAVERKLDTLEAQGVISKVKYSDWAAPLVAISSGSEERRETTIMWWLQGYS